MSGAERAAAGGVLTLAAGSGQDVFINVKDAPYHATGGGIADDEPAIQSAITACASAGGGVVFIPPGKYNLVTKAYAASGWGAHLVVTDDNVRILGAGRGATVLTSSVAGASTIIDFLGYAANTAPNNWASVRFTPANIDPVRSTDVYAIGDRVLTLSTAGHAANYAAGDMVMVATGQVDLTSLAGRGLQPDGCLREVQSVDTVANTLTLVRGLPKPMQVQYFADDGTGASPNQASTLTASAFPAPFGVYQLRDTHIRNVGVSDLTIQCAATSRPALAAHAVKGIAVERVNFRSVSGGLATFVCQEFTEGVFRDIEMDTDGTVGYWGLAMCSDDVLIENVRHIHRTDVAYALNNEGIANVRFRNIQQISAKGAATGLPSFAVGISYNCDVDGLRVVNAGPAAAIAILQNQPAPNYGGGGRLDNVRVSGSVPNVGYVRGNWEIRNVPQSLKLYGDPDNPTTAASVAVPSNNSTRKPKDVQALGGWFPYNQPGGRLYLGRVPALAWIWPPEMDVITAFTSGTTLAVSVRDPVTGTDFDHQLVNGTDVTTTGVKQSVALSTHSAQTAAIEYDVYVNIRTGTPTAGLAYVLLRWVPIERSA